MALQWRHIIQLTRAFLCEMRLDAASLHQIRAERHCRATLQVRVPRQVPLDRPWTQPRSPKFSTSNRRENQKAMLSAGIIYRKQPELKRDSSSCPFPQGNSTPHPGLFITRHLCTEPGYADSKETQATKWSCRSTASDELKMTDGRDMKKIEMPCEWRQSQGWCS